MNFYINSLPLDHHCNVIQFHDSGVLAIEKAPNILTHPNKKKAKNKYERSVLNAEYSHEHECYHWKGSSGEKHTLYLTHRLDSPTSGVLIATNSEKQSQEIKNLFLQKDIRKTYFAVVRPNRPIIEGTWKDSLRENRQKGKIRVTRGNGSLAITKATIERKKGGLYGLALLRLNPLTGRTHQLRVQCALRNHAIIGDKTYGDFSFNRKISKASKIDRLCLHSTEIEFKINTPDGKVNFHADSPLPRSMGKLLLE